MARREPIVVFLHYGDADHRPMQSTSTSSATDLRRRLAEARRDDWPLRVQIEGKPLYPGETHAKEALRLLSGKKKRRSR